MRVTSRHVIALLLLLTAVCAFLPLTPHMPGAGLDESWEIALNQAYVQGLHIGTDVVFTFGPYASLYTALYHPGTDLLMMAGCTYLALCYFLCLCVVTRDRSWRAGLSLAIVVGGMLVSRDALLFSYLALVGLVVFECAARESSSMPPLSSMAVSRINLIIGTLFFSLGLLPLIKGSLIAICAMTIVLGVLWFAWQRRPSTALICAVVPVVGIAVFWLLAGEPLGLLTTFFANMKPIIAGYPEAMGHGEGKLQIVFYLLSAGLSLIAILHRYRREPSKAIYLLAFFAATLFITFKLGFTRRDENHSAAAGSMLVVVAVLLLIELRTRVALMAFGVAIASWGVIEKEDPDKLNVFRQFEQTFASAAEGLVTRVRDPLDLQHRFEAAMMTIRTEEPLPLVQGTTDIYSAHQAALIASGNRWSPRPVFQSYSAYRPELVEMNRRHLLGTAAPQNIFFSIETIDDRLPMLDDGASWPILLSNYAITGRHEGFIILGRKSVIEVAPVLRALPPLTGEMGQSVAIPVSKAPIYAQVDVQTTLFGRVGSFLFKPATIDIEVLLDDGTTHHYRFIPGAAKSAFMISPLIETTEEFGKLYETSVLQNRRRVLSFRLIPTGRGPAYWQNHFEINIAEHTQ